MARVIDPQKTINTILSVSEKLFLEKGYEKTTTQEIVNETGLSKGTIFHHFKSKEDILAAVLDKHNDSTAQDMHKWLSDMKMLTAKEKIVGLFNRFYDDAERTPLSKMALTSRSPRLIIEDLRAWEKKISPIITDIIKEGNQDGSVKTEFPEECAQLFNLLFCIWCDPVTLECSAEDLHKRLRFVQHMMRLLGVDVASDAFIAKSKKFAEGLYPIKSEELS
ncbi:MAG: TetR/AcrR family transcriptional regulator [Oscillospiraceae bacterium]|nr:TetR/AcrR family transcriptional regulator [Oscillospiraceae bacterium]